MENLRPARRCKLAVVMFLSSLLNTVTVLLHRGRIGAKNVPNKHYSIVDSITLFRKLRFHVLWLRSSRVFVFFFSKRFVIRFQRPTYHSKSWERNSSTSRYRESGSHRYPEHGEFLTAKLSKSIALRAEFSSTP